MGRGNSASISSLQESVARLREQNEELLRSKISLVQQRADLREELKETRSENDRLQEKIDQLLRRHFGKSSEKLPANQLHLFGDDGDEQDEAPAPPLDIAADSEDGPDTEEEQKRGPRAPREPRFADDIPTEEIIHDLPEEEKVCDRCETRLTEIGRETSEQIEMVPASFRKIVHVRLKYACKGCEECVRRAPAPVRPLAKCFAAAGLLAWILVSKYKDHLPLNRLSRIFARWGGRISRATLCDWVMACADQLAPVVSHMRDEVLAADYVQTDDTRVLVKIPLARKGKKGNQTRMVQGYLWPYRADQQVVYDFTLSRARDGPESYLQGFEGYLQTDDYVGYHRLQQQPGVTGVGCWAHARRRFYDAFKTNAVDAGPALACIQILYRLEREFKVEELSDDERLAARRERSRPVLADLLRIVRELQREGVAPPKTLVGKAIGYLVRNRKNLVEFTKCGRLAIDNNGVEQCVRPIACGRNNWLFAGSPRGGRAAATLYSLIETCRLQDVEPFEYLRDLLRRLPTATSEEIALLTPGAWKAARVSAQDAPPALTA